MAVSTRAFKRISLFPELKDLGVRYSRRHLDRLEAEGQFPKRVPLGEHRVGWVTDEVIAYVKQQIESRSLAAGTLGSGEPPPTCEAQGRSGVRINAEPPSDARNHLHGMYAV